MIQRKLTENVSVSTKIPHMFNRLVERAVGDGRYLNASNFVREAIAEKLEREGYFLKSAIHQGED